MPDGKKRSGAESLVEVFVATGVDVCFANPGNLGNAFCSSPR